MKLEFSRQIFETKYIQIQNFMTFRPVAPKLFHVDGRTETDRQTDWQTDRLTDRQTDRYNENTTHFSQVCQKHLNMQLRIIKIIFTSSTIKWIRLRKARNPPGFRGNTQCQITRISALRAAESNDCGPFFLVAIPALTTLRWLLNFWNNPALLRYTTEVKCRLLHQANLCAGETAPAGGPQTLWIRDRSLAPVRIRTTIPQSPTNQPVRYSHFPTPSFPVAFSSCPFSVFPYRTLFTT